MPTDLETEIRVDAPLDAVWAVVSDLTRMPEWSTQCRKVVARTPIRQGSLMLNLNREGHLWWPTRATVTDVSHLQRVAWRILDNGTEWSFTLTPEGDTTRITHRRDVPAQGTSRISAMLVDRILGGEEVFEANLLTGMTTTLERIRAAIETSTAPAV